MLLAVHFPQERLFYFTCRVARNIGKDDFSRPLVARQFHAVLVHFFFRTGHARLDADDCTGDLTLPPVRESDDCNVIHLVKFSDKVFDFNRVKVFATGNNDVLLAVNKEDETVFILLCNVTRIKPSVLKHFCSCLGVVVVALHDTRTLYAKLTAFTLLDWVSIVINNLAFPAVTRNTDCTNLVNVFHAKMNASGTN